MKSIYRMTETKRTCCCWRLKWLQNTKNVDRWLSLEKSEVIPKCQPKWATINAMNPKVYQAAKQFKRKCKVLLMWNIVSRKCWQKSYLLLFFNCILFAYDSPALAMQHTLIGRYVLCRFPNDTDHFWPYFKSYTEHLLNHFFRFSSGCAAVS